MRITYQGTAEETSAPTVGAFLEGKGVAAGTAVVEYQGEIRAPGDSLDMPLVEGAALNAFRIVAGG
ncbi:MAG: thiamine biosynthesis protein ThiS [Kiritimatiellae bacterium]|nr:thiamine biosynthesis protein ThiS [Kiritimatiellia bacterium]